MATLSLEQIAAKAKNHTVTPTEKRAQRISMIMGLIPKSSTLTREKAESLLNEFEGHETPAQKKTG